MVSAQGLPIICSQLAVQKLLHRRITAAAVAVIASDAGILQRLLRAFADTAANHGVDGMGPQKSRQGAVPLTVCTDDARRKDDTVGYIVQFKGFRFAEMGKYLFLIVGNRYFHFLPLLSKHAAGRAFRKSDAANLRRRTTDYFVLTRGAAGSALIYWTDSLLSVTS